MKQREKDVMHYGVGQNMVANRFEWKGLKPNTNTQDKA